MVPIRLVGQIRFFGEDGLHALWGGDDGEHGDLSAAHAAQFAQGLEQRATGGEHGIDHEDVPLFQRGHLGIVAAHGVISQKSRPTWQ